MTYFRALVAVAIVAGVSASAIAFTPAPLPKNERKRTTDDLSLLQGTYKVLDYGRPNLNGRAVMRRENMKVRITGDKFQFLYQNGNDFVPSTTYEMKITPKAAPKLLDMTYTSGDYTLTMKGIYKIEGSKVTLAYVTAYTGRIKQLQEPERPTSFEELPPVAILMVLERE